MYDTFHANIEEKDVGKAIAGLGDSFIHVHISENDRGTPGTGQVRWDETFQALYHTFLFLSYQVGLLKEYLKEAAEREAK